MIYFFKVVRGLQTGKSKQRRLTALFISTVLMGVLLPSIVFTKLAFATTLNPDPPTPTSPAIPGNYKYYFESCDGSNAGPPLSYDPNPALPPSFNRPSPAFQSWISPAGQPANDSIFSVPSGAASIPLEYHFSGAVCEGGHRTYAQSSHLKILSATAAPAGVISGATGTVQNLTFNGVPVKFDQDRVAFTYAPVGGFNTPGTSSYTITFDERKINDFANPSSPGRRYQCIDSPYNFIGGLNYNACSPNLRSITINITVGPSPVLVSGKVYDSSGNPISGAIFAACGGFSGTTSGASGDYSTYVNDGGSFCIPTPTSIPAGYDGPFIRPVGGFTMSRTGCGPFTTALPSTPADCNPQNSYQNQIAGRYSGNGDDRSVDDGYDFVVTPTQPPGCGTFGPVTGIEPGDTYQINGAFINNSATTSITSPSYDVSMDIHDQNGTLVATYSNLPFMPAGPGGTAPYDTSRRPAITSPIGTYSVTATLTGPGITKTCNWSYRVASKPYMRVYGGDILAGNSVDPDRTCPQTSTGGIYGNNAGAPAGAGSGVQYAAQALGDINEFASAMTRPTAGPAPIPLLGLAFSNTTTPPGPGNFGTAPCTIDYFAALPTGFSPSAYSGSSGTYFYPGDLILSTPTIVNNGVRAALYVNGDVYINSNSNIQYARTSWILKDIPAFWIIAKGNIYIDASVSRLDGVYIAQKDNTGSRGKIYTCTSGGSNFSIRTDGLPDPGNISYINACNNNLTINGAFIAQTVKFQRTKGTLRDSSNADDINQGAPAETFLYSPELWLIDPPIYGTKSNASYDSITGLPPIL